MYGTYMVNCFFLMIIKSLNLMSSLIPQVFLQPTEIYSFIIYNIW